MRAPATRDQADAYRFGLRRLEAALVRGDPVPLHEQIRTQRRATLAGVLLGLLGLCAAAAYAALAPRPDWRAQDLVVGAGSGAMYAVAHRPDRLVPVTNLVAARLVLAGLREAGASDADPGRAAPVTVADDTLAGAPRAPAPAVPGAFAADPGRLVAPSWAVCDEVGADGRIVATTVVGGAIPTPPMPPDNGALLADDDGVTWLVSAGRRHRTDLGDDRLVAVYGLVGARPRAVSGALLAVLPEGPGLATPVVTGRGGPGPRGVPGRVGDVLVARAVGGQPRYFVVLSGGLQQVSEVVAELLRMASVAREFRPVPLELVATVPAVEELPVAGWPAPSPRLLAAAQAPLLCWGWAAGGSAGGVVSAGAAALPVPAGMVPVALSWADGAGPQLDAVAVGAGGVVRAAGSGAWWLISATGIGYPVLDAETAAALGITAAEPAPDVVLALIPTGAPLALERAGPDGSRGPAGN